MTDAERRRAIHALIEKHTIANTASKKIARKSLIAEGIYTENGELRVEFGGKPERPKKAKTAA
jgi:hypothetical protein